MKSPVKIETDSLGFLLTVNIVLTDEGDRGQHRTYEHEGVVPPDAPHQITLNVRLRGSELSEVIAHEAYRLFYSIRPLITVDEETEAEVFGHLVLHMHNIVLWGQT